jgi:argininosuccinate synthase
MKEKVILAYSGGLDTSVMVKWLANNDYNVIAYIADVGQNVDFNKIKSKALNSGASKVYIEDLKKELVEKYIFEMLKTNAIYEGKYLLGTAIARPIIAKKQVDIANKEKTKILAHGCTGKGNDQVRFELTWMKFLPDVKIISPWKEDDWLSEFKGRKDLINYAKKEKIPIDVSLKKSYSTDENLLHISHESGILEEIDYKPKEDIFKFTKSPKNAPDKEIEIIIEFSKGIPSKVINKTEKKEVKGSLELFTYLNKIAGENGIGRIDIVENRFVGIKSRGVYETPAGTILFKAHQDLESITLDKDVIYLKDLLAPVIAKIIYNGFWFSPEMEMLMAAINKSQENVTGEVYLTLYKGNVIIYGRKSNFSLYDKDLSSMDIEGCYNQKDAAGFIKITGLKFKILGAKNEALETKLQNK